MVEEIIRLKVLILDTPSLNISLKTSKEYL